MIDGQHRICQRWWFIFLLSILFNSSCLMAHGDEIELNTSGPAQSVKLTPEQTKMLGIEVSQASARPMADFLNLNGQIQLLPNAQADVSVRISGAVTDIMANLGKSVHVQSDSLFTFRQNWCSLSIRMSVHFGAEYAIAAAQITI